MFEKILSTQDYRSLQDGKMEAQPKLKLKNRFEYFLVSKLEEAIKDNLVAQQEKVEIALVQKPVYNEFNKRFYSRGLLKVGSKYFLLHVEANSEYIFIRSKPIRLVLSWKDIEGEKQ